MGHAEHIRETGILQCIIYTTLPLDSFSSLHTEVLLEKVGAGVRGNMEIHVCGTSCGVSCLLSTSPGIRIWL